MIILVKLGKNMTLTTVVRLPSQKVPGWLDLFWRSMHQNQNIFKILMRFLIRMKSDQNLIKKRPIKRQLILKIPHLQAILPNQLPYLN